MVANANCSDKNTSGPSEQKLNSKDVIMVDNLIGDILAFMSLTAEDGNVPNPGLSSEEYLKGFYSKNETAFMIVSRQITKHMGISTFDIYLCMMKEVDGHISKCDDCCKLKSKDFARLTFLYKIFAAKTLQVFTAEAKGGKGGTGVFEFKVDSDNFGDFLSIVRDAAEAIVALNVYHCAISGNPDILSDLAFN